MPSEFILGEERPNIGRGNCSILEYYFRGQDDQSRDSLMLPRNFPDVIY